MEGEASRWVREFGPRLGYVVELLEAHWVVGACPAALVC